MVPIAAMVAAITVMTTAAEEFADAMASAARVVVAHGLDQTRDVSGGR